MLGVWASHGLAEENRAFAEALRRQPRADLLAVALESDHAFADKRIALAATVVRWLEGLR